VLGKWPIRVKFLVGLGLLLLLVVILSSGSLYSTYTYRSLVIDLSGRANEMPLSGKFGQQVAELRITLSELRGLGELGSTYSSHIPLRAQMIRNQFQTNLDEVEELFSDYRTKLEKEFRAGSPISDNQREWNTVHKIESDLARIREESLRQEWTFDRNRIDRLDGELKELQLLAAELPSYLYDKMSNFRDDVRSQYRTLIIGTWITSISAGLIFALFVKLFYQWVFQPLRLLIAGSRRVAAGQFGHRIHLESHDEMAELAEAMNHMTASFQAVRDDLDRQVQERTKQVVRGEQLASVGFLAAGVAHEINNPLASIAMCAESLETRIQELLVSGDPEHAVIANYLQMIQGEAFRCKGITERLLDFSRIGQGKRQNTDLGELVQGVIEMVGHLGKYQHKEVRLEVEGPILAPVNPQEIKQVVLNLLTNAFDSIEGNGLVRVHVGHRAGFAEITVIDNGCGMSPEVMEHIFEPFFTRRREGQGTGLGLSISYRIIADHGGQLEAQSPGPGQGATFRVRLPSPASQKEDHHQYLAA
jgi:two-component system, NtrC family, sensor kinase